MEDQSKLTFKQMLSALLRSNRRHARYIQAFACLAVLVAVAVPLVMRQYGVAMTTTETRLACQYAGNGAHTHNADCYDAYGNLVCPLPEKPFHTHTDSCYATERVLTCALPETEGHTHGDACYDEEGNLTCTLAEEPAHTHSDACYETRTTDQLICGMEETTEEHVHGPACFETVTVNVPDPEPEPTTTTPAEPEATVPSTPEEDPTPAQEFSDVLKKKDQDGNEYVYLVVQVKAPQGALPKGSAMSLAHVDLQKREVQDGPTIQDKLNEVLRKEAGEEAAFVQTDAVDITFKDSQGNRIDPAKKVEVRITTSMIRTFSDQRTASDEAVINNSLLVLHVVDKQQTKRTDAPDAELIRKAVLVNQDEKDTSTGHEDTIVFEAQEFSPYIVARVNNAALAPEPEPEPEPEVQPAESEQPAAEATLDLTTEDQPAEAEPERPAQSFTHRFTDTNGQALMRVDVLAPEGAFPLGTTMQVKWVDASHIEESVTQAVSERTDGKLRDMRAVDITFIDADGHEIEPAKKITVTFASDLIDTQDDAYVVHVDDEGKSEVIDALGSKELEKREMPDQADELVFESDAFSTYVVAVTTLHKELTASDGATYDITVDAPAEAGIPQDAELRVSEIVEGDEGYAEYLAQAQSALGEETDAIRLARFFDIKIMNNGEEIQPQAPVKVDIQLADVEALGTQISPNAVHFLDGGLSPEVIEATQNGSSASFDASGFSIYGVIYTVDFHWSFNGQSYDFSIDGGDTLSLYELLTALNVITPDNEDEFMGKVADVAFSDSSLIAVTKLDDNITAGQLKKDLNISTQYSAQLRSDAREQMDAKELLEGDWALITLKEFDTSESLTVTMDNGDAFVIQVTDAQVYTDVLSADGNTYHIVITYDAEAEIPEGSELTAREVIPGSVEYDMYLSDAAAQVGTYAEDITFARFFDLEITHDGEKVEPKAPVQVSIEYADAMSLEQDEELSVVHFADEGTEVIDNLEVSDNQKEVTYEQASFSVTGTIINNGPNGLNDKCMVLVNYPENSDNYYIVKNDGSLTKVTYNQSSNTVDVDNPMLWTIEGNNPNVHIYMNAEATGFDWRKIASGYYRRYLDPSSDTGIYEETADTSDINHIVTQEHHEGSGDYRRWYDDVNNKWVYPVTVSNRDNAMGKTAIDSYNNRIYKTSWNTGIFMGVELDDDGNPIHLAGNKSSSDSARIVLARANEVPAVGQSHHTVDHVDISIESTAGITVPLAYGTYWYGDPSNPESMHSFTVTSDIDVDLEAEKVSVSPDDMKRATIKAYDKNGNELNNAFVVSGYSSNAATDFSTPQVRIEGRFKVANLNYDGDNYSQAVRNDRLNNKITYTVSVVKPITFDVKDDDHGQLYEKLADGSFRKVSLTVDINTTASFDYWDERNECPAVQNIPGTGSTATGFSETRWQSGEIDPSGLSGMDFVLGGDADDANAKVVALEITKMVMDENHRLIKMANPYSQGFEIYASNQKQHGTAVDNYMNVIGVDVPTYQGEYVHNDYYTRIHSKDVMVGTDGMGLVFDYDVTPGMYYITEDASEIPDEIVDVDGNTWTYVESRIETEYVWRNDQYSGRHVSATFTDKNNDSYRGIPEVAGVYTGSHNSPAAGQEATDYTSPTWEWVNPKTGQTETGTFRNGFLEFFVYNIYESGTKLEVEKQWETGSQPPDGTEVTFELRYRMRQTGQMVEGEMRPLAAPGEWTDFALAKNNQGEGKIFKEGLNTTLTLDSKANWEGSFISLPKTYTDGDSKVYELDYDAEETSVKIPGAGKTVVDEDAIDVTSQYKVTKGEKSEETEDSDGKITFINTKGGLIFEKKWLNSSGAPITAPTGSDLVVTGELWRKGISGSEAVDRLVTVTIQAVDGSGLNNAYNNGQPVTLWTGQVVEGSDLVFAVAANTTSNLSMEYITTNNGSSIEGPTSVGEQITFWSPLTKNENNALSKNSYSKYTLKNAADGTVITASFPAKNGPGINRSGPGYRLFDPVTEPQTTAVGPAAPEKVQDITLSQVNGWRYSLSSNEMDPNWEYYIKTGTITEEGASSSQYTFNAGPIVSTDEDGNTVYSCTNMEKPTVDINLLKADSETVGTSNVKYLEGATFYLTKYDSQQQEASYEPTVISLRDNTSVNVVADGGHYKFTIPTTSGVKITGLMSGTYVLHEVSAPDGYNVTTDGWTFTVDVDDLDTPIKNAEGTAASDVASGLILTIPNPPGAELPEAGGPGTLLHTLCGLVLFAAAGYVGLASKRSARKEVA